MHAKRVNRNFIFLESVFFAIMFLTDGFFAELLSMFGYGDSFIGLVMMSMGISCLIMQPLFGYFCDKFRNFRGLFFCVYGLMAIMLPLLFKFQHNKVMVLLYTVIAMSASKSLFSVLDSWISKLQNEFPTLDYGRIRSCGSFSYAIASIILAQLILRFGNGSTVWLFWILFAFLTCALFIIPNPSEIVSDRGLSIKSASKALVKSRNYIVFLICGLLVSIPHVAMLLFSSRLISSLGGNIGDIGIANFIMAGSEILVIMNFTKIANKLGTELTLGLGMLGTAVKAVVLASCPTAEIAMFAFVTQALSYALLIPGAVRFISEQIPRTYIATAMLMYQTLCQSLAQIVGSPFFGAIAEKYSVSAMYGVVSIFGFIGSIAFLIYCRSKWFINPTQGTCNETFLQPQKN